MGSLKTNYYFSLAFSTLISVLCFSQTQDYALKSLSLKDITPPSPMAYELTRYEAQQPNLYNGTANISVPLYTIDFDGWKLPLSLSYNASGITTNQEATEVGLGWALNGTAIITRQVNGGNDLYNDNHQSGHKGYVYSYSEINDLKNYQNLNESQKSAIFTDLIANRIDSEPDTFRYNFFGYSGAFSLSPKLQPTDPILIDKHQINGVKISYDELNQNFTIITPEGFIGYFTIKERTTNVSGAATDFGVGMPLKINGNYFDAQQSIIEGKFRVITGWYLEKIISPNGKEIQFKYNINSAANSRFHSVTQVAFGENAGYRFLPIYPNGSGVGYPEQSSIPISGFSRQIVEHVYQESITIPNELEINFLMEDREDLQPNILIKNYFFGEAPDLDFYDPNNPYEINNYNPFEELNANQPLPKRYSGIVIRGLNYNSSFTKTIHINQSYFNQSAQETPEYSIYQYLRSRLDSVSINDQTYKFTYTTGFGLPVKSTLGVDHFGYYNGKHFENQTGNGPKKVNHGYAIHYNNGVPMGEIINSYYFDNILPKQFFYVQNANRKANLNFGIGGALINVEYPTGGSSWYTYEPHEYKVNGKSSQTSRLVPEAINNNGDAGVVQAGGLRIKSIENRDRLGNIVTKKSYNYKTSFNESSGQLMTPMLYFQDFGLDGSLLRVSQIASNNSGTATGPVKAFHFDLSIPGSHTAGGRRIGYSRVEEITENIIEPSKSFKTIYEYENTPVSFSMQSSPSFILESELNGTPIFQVDLDNDSNLKRAINFQNGIYTNGSYLEAIRYSSLVYNFDRVSQYQGAALLTGLQFVPFINYKKPFETINVTERKTIEYFNSGNIENTVNYEFNGKNQLNATESLNSDGEILRKVTKRLSDYNSTNCVYSINQPSECLQEFMETNNIIEPILEEIIYKCNQVIGATGYRYDIEHDNLVLKEIFSYEKSNGVFTASANGFEFLGNYVSRVVFEDYDNKANLLQQKPKDGTTISYLWGYNNDYPVAKVENSTYGDIVATLTPSELTGIQNGSYNQLQMRTALDKIRIDLPEAMVTTYTYDPLTGVNSITDVKGTTTYYDYNPLNRLENIKDVNQKIVQEFKYNYTQEINSTGLNIPNLFMGSSTSNVSVTKKLPITNFGNTDITITNVILPAYFSSTSPTSFTLKPHETFDYSITFNAPSFYLQNSNNIIAEFVASNGQSYFSNLYIDHKAPPPPNFSTTGYKTATCSSGMSGTITVTSGSVIVLNKPYGGYPGGVSAPISLSGDGHGYLITANNSVILTPSSYPITYAFSSNNYNCTNGYGYNEIKVTTNSQN